MISKEEVIKLAKLARLDFSDDELDKIIKDMDDIIAFADTINNSVEGDADKIRNISTSATPAEEFRKDEVKPSLPNEKILSNVNKYINAIENDNPKYNAYVSTTFEKALENAKFADKLIAEGKSSALTGIPMTLKDNICSDGDLTTCCSKILEGFRPYYDSTVWTKLKAQGAVMLGKTNMDEFAMGSTSETSVYGAPLNPRNTNHVTGSCCLR